MAEWIGAVGQETVKLREWEVVGSNPTAGTKYIGFFIRGIYTYGFPSRNVLPIFDLFKILNYLDVKITHPT